MSSLLFGTFQGLKSVTSLFREGASQHLMYVLVFQTNSEGERIVGPTLYVFHIVQICAYMAAHSLMLSKSRIFLHFFFVGGGLGSDDISCSMSHCDQKSMVLLVRSVALGLYKLVFKFFIIHRRAFNLSPLLYKTCLLVGRFLLRRHAFQLASVLSSQFCMLNYSYFKSQNTKHCPITVVRR